jgi:hypothetical protein
MSNEITLWEGGTLVRIPPHARTPEDILPHANPRQLTAKDRVQIIYAFNNHGYEMVTTFVWNKAISSLKAQLGTLGTAFIAEMLDRPDIAQESGVAHVLTDYDALRLARELGVVNSTGYLRLKQAFDLIAHFGQLAPEEADESEMSSNDVIGVIRACVETILGQSKIDVALDFKKFRDHLESDVYQKGDSEIANLENSPYFFKRASIRILLAIIKSNSGAQLENALGNANLIIPLIWSQILPPERFQIGRVYSEIVSDGKTQAASGLKKILLKVKGFDYVPEDLRSRTFTAAAQSVIDAHEGMNNFYNEPGPTRTLAQLGSTIPRPAFALCMTAVLSVKLGNPYGFCYEAQTPANSILKKVTSDRWLFYLDNCLRADERILEKLDHDLPFARWTAIVEEYNLNSIVADAQDRDVKLLVQESKNPQKPIRARQILGRILKKMGYAAES